MIRSLLTVAAAATLSVGGLATVARAEPPGCSYTLSAPEVAHVSGSDIVTATLAVGACNQSDSYLLVVCVQKQGSQTAEQCQENKGLLTTRVYYAPHQPGATYISTGRGCALTGNPRQPVCQSEGPLTATL